MPWVLFVCVNVSFPFGVLSTSGVLFYAASNVSFGRIHDCLISSYCVDGLYKFLGSIPILIKIVLLIFFVASISSDAVVLGIVATPLHFVGMLVSAKMAADFARSNVKTAEERYHASRKFAAKVVPEDREEKDFGVKYQ